MQIHRLAIHQNILQLTAGRVACFYKHKDTLIVLIAGIDKRLDAIYTQVRVHGDKVLMPEVVFFPRNFRSSNVRSISRRGGANVAALDVADHNKAHLLCARRRFFISRKARKAIALIKRDLWLHGRHNPLHSLKDRQVEGKEHLRNSLGRFSMLCEFFLP